MIAHKMVTHKTKSSVVKRPLPPQPHPTTKPKDPNKRLPIHENAMLPELPMAEPLDLDDILTLQPVH